MRIIFIVPHKASIMLGIKHPNLLEAISIPGINCTITICKNRDSKVNVMLNEIFCNSCLKIKPVP